MEIAVYLGNGAENFWLKALEGVLHH